MKTDFKDFKPVLICLNLSTKRNLNERLRILEDERQR